MGPEKPAATPRSLAGEKVFLHTAALQMKSMLAGYPARSILLFGLSSIDKSALLRKTQNIAAQYHLPNHYIKLSETNNLAAFWATACTDFVRSLHSQNSTRELRSALNAFCTTWYPKEKASDWERKNQPFECALSQTGGLSNDFTELLSALGKTAKQAHTAVCLFIDEIQLANREELEALMTALHRLNQLGLPILFFCAGSPEIRKMIGNIKPYAERLFTFVPVASLDN